MAIRFVIGGDLRFISHGDSLRMFGRALGRAGLPVRYTGGFNPRPRVWLPLPRPVGIAGDDELLIVELAGPMASATVLDRLAERVPRGIALQEAGQLDSDRVPRAVEARYRLVLSEQQGAVVKDAAQAIEQSESYCVTRTAKPGGCEDIFDIRPSLLAIGCEGGNLEFTLGAGPSGSAKPREVLQALGLPEELLADVRRIGITWQPDLDESGPAGPMTQG
jgi:radical SAM-linked protein